MKKILDKRIFQLGIVLIFGLFMGWLVFSNKSTDEKMHSDTQIQATEFTCSMHPQIRQNEPGRCPICGMELIPVSAQIDPNETGNPFVHIMSPEAVALANIQTQKVKSAIPEFKIPLTGKIAVNEQRLAAITANYSGRIEKLYIDFTGQIIERGQKLATIYSPELITAQKELIEASKFKEINPTLYYASMDKLRLWQINENQINQIKEKGAVLTEFDFYSDKSGVVVTREVSEGDFVNRGSILFEIADLNNVWVILDAFESDLPLMRIGQKLTFTLNSVPGKEFSSTVSFIDPFVNPQTRTISVRAEVSNPGLVLKPGMFINAVVKSKPSTDVLSVLIPNTALLWTGKRSVVYVKIPDMEFPAFEMREIKLGASTGDFYIVEEGLVAGEEIVVNGVFAIDAAAQLRGNYSMMNRPVSKTISVPVNFIEQLTTFVTDYFSVKNNLVLSDFNQAAISSSGLIQSFGKIETNLLSDNTRTVWLEHETFMKNYLDKMSKSVNLEEQRINFATLSNELIKIIERFGLTIETVYVNYCPMALNDTGAYWLSEFEEIKNPYFGDAMLSCGEVKQILNAVGNRNEMTRKPPVIHQH